MDAVDIVVVGAGVLGLAVAHELAGRWKNKSILVIEKNASFGQEMSSRTSEVIHSGIYYPTGSRKARLCVEGNEMLYSFCRRWNVPHKRLGKLIIARDEKDLPALAALHRQGHANGVGGLTLLDKEEVAELEPHICAQGGLLSENSGILDSHAFMARLEQNARERGAMIVYRHEVTSITHSGGCYQVYYKNADGDEDGIECRFLINAAGHACDRIAAMAGIDIDKEGYRIYKCKGDYFAVNNHKAALVSRLIFPVSIRELKGTGIPVLKDMNGRLRLGPDAGYCPAAVTSFRVNPAKASQFLSVVGPYLPFLEADDLEPDMAGLRPRLLVPCGSPPHDFIIRHEADRGLPGMMNLIGIESPGMTCCLSLAAMIGKHGDDLLKKILLTDLE